MKLTKIKNKTQKTVGFLVLLLLFALFQMKRSEAYDTSLLSHGVGTAYETGFGVYTPFDARTRTNMTNDLIGCFGNKKTTAGLDQCFGDVVVANNLYSVWGSGGYLSKDSLEGGKALLQGIVAYERANFGENDAPNFWKTFDEITKSGVKTEETEETERERPETTKPKPGDDTTVTDDLSGPSECSPEVPIDLNGDIKYVITGGAPGIPYRIDAGVTSGTYNVPAVDFFLPTTTAPTTPDTSSEKSGTGASATKSASTTTQQKRQTLGEKKKIDAVGIPTVESGPLLNIIANFTPALKSVCANMAAAKKSLAVIEKDIDGKDGLLEIARRFETKTFVDDPAAVLAAGEALKAGAEEYKKMKNKGRTDLLGVGEKSFTPTASSYEAEMRHATAKQTYAAVEKGLNDDPDIDEATKQQILSDLQLEVDNQAPQAPDINTKIAKALAGDGGVYDIYPNIQAIFDKEVADAGNRARAELAGGVGVVPVLGCEPDELITTADGTKICPPTRAHVITPADEISAPEKAYAEVPIKKLAEVKGRTDYGASTPQANTTKAVKSIPANILAGNAIGGNHFSSSSSGGGVPTPGPTCPGDPSCPAPVHNITMTVAPLILNGLNFSQITWSSAKVKNVTSCKATTDWITFGDGSNVSTSKSNLVGSGEAIEPVGSRLVQKPLSFKATVTVDDGTADNNNLPPPEQANITNSISKTATTVTQTSVYTPTITIPSKGFDADDTITLTINGATATTNAFGLHSSISADELLKNLLNQIKNGPSATTNAFKNTYEITTSGGKLTIKDKNPVPANIPASAKYALSCESEEGVRTKNVTISF